MSEDDGAPQLVALEQIQRQVPSEASPADQRALRKAYEMLVGARPAEAATAFGRVTDSNSPPLVRRYAAEMAAVSWWAARQYDRSRKAAELWQRLSAARVDRARAATYRGIAVKRLDGWVEAADELETALAAAPDVHAEPVFVSYYKLALAHSGRFERIAAMYRRFLDEADASNKRGKLAEALGDVYSDYPESHDCERFVRDYILSLAFAGQVDRALLRLTEYAETDDFANSDGVPALIRGMWEADRQHNGEPHAEQVMRGIAQEHAGTLMAEVAEQIVDRVVPDS